MKSARKSAELLLETEDYLRLARTNAHEALHGHEQHDHVQQEIQTTLGLVEQVAAIFAHQVLREERTEKG